MNCFTSFALRTDSVIDSNLSNEKTEVGTPPPRVLFKLLERFRLALAPLNAEVTRPASKRIMTAAPLGKP
jgi:hypothetical protein